MSRWFRFYDDAINDPKILKLPDNLFRFWVGILCIASKNNGVIPPAEDVAVLVRSKLEKTRGNLNKLVELGLLDQKEGGVEPHNWAGRQFKSDVSTERVKRFRNAGKTVSETPPDTEQSQIQNKKESRTPEGENGTIVEFPSPYAFEGEIIRLRQDQFDRWEKLHPKIDLTAELGLADAYYVENPPKDGKWFFPVSRWLEKANREQAFKPKRKGVYGDDYW